MANIIIARGKLCKGGVVKGFYIFDEVHTGYILFGYNRFAYELLERYRGQTITISLEEPEEEQPERDIEAEAEAFALARPFP